MVPLQWLEAVNTLQHLPEKSCSNNNWTLQSKYICFPYLKPILSIDNLNRPQIPVQPFCPLTCLTVPGGYGAKVSLNLSIKVLLLNKFHCEKYICFRVSPENHFPAAKKPLKSLTAANTSRYLTASVLHWKNNYTVVSIKILLCITPYKCPGRLSLPC